MRLQPPDPLSTTLIWITAIFMALREGVEAWPAAKAAIPAMSAGWLSFVPLGLLAIAAIVTIRHSIEQPTAAPVSRNSATDLATLKVVPAEELPPSFALSGAQSKWKPDIPLRDGLIYFGRDAGKAGYHDKTRDVLRNFVTALREGKITAWGKEHPGEQAEFQIRPQFWNQAEVTLDTDYAFSGYLNCGAFAIRVSSDELKLIWPPKNPSPAAA